MTNETTKRLTPKQLIKDVSNVLYLEHKILSQIETLSSDGLIRQSLSLFELNVALKIDIDFFARNLRASLNQVLDSYDESYWKAFIDEDVVLDENVTLAEIIASLKQMISSEDENTFLKAIIDGQLFIVYQRLHQLCLHSHWLSKQLFYDYYSRVFYRLIESYDNKDIHKSSIHHLKKQIFKAKPLKPILNQKKVDEYLCPNCNQVLFSTNQLYCHHCGQRMNNFQIGKRRKHARD